MSRLLFIFLDGVGIGVPSSTPPFSPAGCRYLPFYQGGSLPDGTPVIPLDATLGIGGPPQSATGQTTLFTGVNVPQLIKRHTGSFPNRFMRRLIFRQNMLKDFRTLTPRAFFLNAYPRHEEYFTPRHVNLTADGGLQFSEEFPHTYRRSISVSTCMLLSCRLTPFGCPDIANGKALYQDFTNRQLIEAGLSLPLYTARRAAEILASSVAENDFILYEYFLTDLAAHRQPHAQQIRLIKALDILVGTLLSKIDPDKTTLVITSDHGNLEDRRRRQHTRNPVPLLTWGQKATEVRNGIFTIADLYGRLWQTFHGTMGKRRK
jgi:hypothetical protein